MGVNSQTADLHERLSVAARGSVLVTLATMAVSLITQVWLARRFGPSGLGEYNATTLYVTSLATIATLGLSFTVLERIGAVARQGDLHVRRHVEGAFAVALTLGGAAGLFGLFNWG